MAPRALREKKLVPITRLTELERDAARLQGEAQGGLAASIAEAKAKIADTELQLLQAEQDYQREVASALIESEDQISQLDKTKSVAEAALKQTEIRAAQAGIVRHALRTRVGETVNPGEEVMRIVPHVGGVSVEARLSYGEARRLRVGQPVELQFAGSSGDAAPVRGTLARLRADTKPDAGNGYSRSYTAQVVVPADEVSRLGAAATAAGSRAEVEVQSSGCSDFGCLVHPIGHAISRAYRSLRHEV